MARDIALTHHEKWDGTGYPRGLKGEEIPLVGRICGICDVYDALLSRRPYKDPWPPEVALNEIKEGGGHHFDPQLTELFFNTLPRMEHITHKYADTPECVE